MTSETATSLPPGDRSFFVTGGTVARDAECYVERSADTELYEGLKQGEFCYVLTGRQMGKSSLMVRVAGRLEKENYAVAVLDLTAVGGNLTPEQWYDGLLVRLSEQLDLETELEDFWQSQSRLGPLQRWVAALRHLVLDLVDRPITIFLDEIDLVNKLPFPTNEFFAAIRALYNERAENPELRRLAFCLVGVATPSDLIQDSRTTPFNIGRRIKLEDFTAEEAAPLSRGLGGGSLATTLLRRALHWTQGHPYLTQSLCRSIAEDPSVRSKSGVDRLCRDMFFSNQARETNSNLVEVRNQMLRGGDDPAAVLDLYKKILRGKKVRVDETDARMNVLRLAGSVRAVGTRLRLRNPIYTRVFDRAWLDVHMPGAEKRRQKIAFRSGALRAGLAATAIVVILGLGIFLYFEYNVWPHAIYYNTSVKRWGVPAGVGKLTGAQVKKRSSSIKLITRGRSGPVIKAQVVNSADELNPRHLIDGYLQEASESPESGRECEWEFVRDTQGRVLQEKAYNRFGQMVWGLAYSPQETGSSSRRAHFLGPDGLPQPQKKTAAEIIEFDYSAEGYEIHRRYFDRAGEPQSGPNRAFGEKFVRDERGLEVQSTSLDRDGRPLDDEDGNATQKLSYNDLGSIVEARFFDADGKPTLVKAGYFGVFNLYDDYGNLLESSVFDVEGRPTLSKGGVHTTVWRYDDHGNAVEYAFFDKNGQATLSKSGIHKAALDYDDRGNVIEIAYFDQAGDPTLDKMGIHRGSNRYDERGNVIRWAVFDTEGKATLSKEGVHRAVQSHDERGNIREITVFDDAGEPALLKTGYHRASALYDERGNRVETSYFGALDEPATPTANNYHRWTLTYDERGNPVEWKAFDVSGEPAVTKAGYHRLERRFDDRGNVVEWRAFGVSGEPVVTVWGYHRTNSSYDDRNNEVEFAAFDGDGKPVMTWSGYARRKKTFDSRDNLTAVRFFDTENRPTLSSSGYHLMKWSYDGRDRVVGGAVFNTSGEPMNNSDDYHRWRWHYDDRDRVVEFSVFDIAGRRTTGRTGFHQSRTVFDDRDNALELATYDVSGKPIVAQNNYHRLSQVFDKRDNLIESAVFDAEGLPTRNLEGYHRKRVSFDKQDKALELAVYDVSDQPTHGRDGFFRTVYSYDEHGNLSETSYYDIFGVPATTGAQKIFEYDNLGRVTRAAFTDQNGKAVAWNRQLSPLIGYTGFEVTYSEDQAFRTTEYFGFDDHWGYARAIIRYEAGKEIERTYLDASGREVEVAITVTFVLPNSWAERNGIQVGDILFRYDGQPIENQALFIREREAEDPRGPTKPLLVRRDGLILRYQLPPGKMGILIQGRDPDSRLMPTMEVVLPDSG